MIPAWSLSTAQSSRKYFPFELRPPIKSPLGKVIGLSLRNHLIGYLNKATQKVWLLSQTTKAAIWFLELEITPKNWLVCSQVTFETTDEEK